MRTSKAWTVKSRFDEESVTSSGRGDKRRQTGANDGSASWHCEQCHCLRGENSFYMLVENEFPARATSTDGSCQLLK